MADSQQPVVANSHAAAAVAIAVAAVVVAVVAAVAVVVAVAVPMLRPWRTANDLLWQIATQLQRWR